MKKLSRNARLVAGLLLVLSVPLLAQSGGRGRHKRIFVVPRPGKVTIDGKLDDWDLSGQIWMYVTRQTAEMQSARFAMMYDEQALYVSAEVRDPNPMMNRHDPLVDPDRAWDADACHLRMVLDPAQGYPVNQGTYNPVPNDQMVHMILWYYTDRKEPNLHLSYGMDYAPPKSGYPKGAVPHDRFQAAYRKAEDGRGYTFEYRIPWDTLEARNPPKAGDLVAATAQVDWSRPDGLKTAGGSAWAYDVMSGPGFPFQSSACWGKAIFSKTGNLPRELTEEGVPPERPLPLRFEYDLPKGGDVTIALIDDEGQMVRQLIAQAPRRTGHVVERWDGLDDLGRPLPAGKYTWRGLYHDPIKTRFILSVHNSGQPPYKLDDNTGGWGGDHANPTTVCTAGENVIMAWRICESGWGIIRTDLEGKKQWGSKHTATYLATDGEHIFAAGSHGFDETGGVRVFDLADCRPLSFASGNPEIKAPAGGEPETDRVTGLACANRTLYISYGERDMIGLFDAKQGTLKESWKVPAPGRLAARPDGTILAISAGKVVALRAGKAVPLVTDHLDDPVGIALDAAGNIYVANCGERQNVSVFSPGGEYLRSIGKKGGRPPVGRYDRRGMLEPGGIAVDREGKLWVAETLDSPRRISVWDTRTGKLKDEFFGGSAYSTWVYMDPRHPDEVYCHNVLWKVDLDRRTWHPYSTIWRSTGPNVVYPPSVGSYGGHLRVITARNGRQYAWGMCNYSNELLMRDGDAFKPIAAGIIVLRGNPFVKADLYPVMSEPEEFPDGTYIWQDKNDDQTIQKGELMRPDYIKRGESIINWVDEDLNLWCDSGHLFRPVRFEDDRPVYDFTRPEEIPFTGHNSNYTSLWLDPDGSVYTLSPGRDPGFAKWTRDGKLLWAHRDTIAWPKAINKPPLKPGDLWGPTMPLGVAGDFTGMATYFGPFHIFTRDGLYVAMVFRDGRLGGVGPDVIVCESFSGQLVRPAGMDRYFLLAGDQDGRITEILGLDTVKRLKGGTYVLTEEDVEKAAGALAEFEASKRRQQKLVIVRGRPALMLSPGVSRIVDDKRAFTARVAYDRQNLYVAYEVESDVELVNAIADARLIFKGGNCLDIQLAADPNADPKRTKPAPGDLRILVTRQEGNPRAVIYRPRVKGFGGKPIVLSSPTGRESFDSIETSARIALEYKKKPAGFSATVTVPLSEVGLKLTPGQAVRLDLGYIFGNSTGTQAALRAYWNNNSFSANVINDIPNESRLEPHEWGTAMVE